MKDLNSYDISMVSGGLISDSFSEREQNVFDYGISVGIGGSWILGLTIGVPAGAFLGAAAMMTPVGMLYGAAIGTVSFAFVIQGLLYLGTYDTEAKLTQA